MTLLEIRGEMFQADGQTQRLTDRHIGRHDKVNNCHHHHHHHHHYVPEGLGVFPAP